MLDRYGNILPSTWFILGVGVLLVTLLHIGQKLYPNEPLPQQQEEIMIYKDVGGPTFDVNLEIMKKALRRKVKQAPQDERSKFNRRVTTCVNANTCPRCGEELVGTEHSNKLVIVKECVRCKSEYSQMRKDESVYVGNVFLPEP